MAGVTEILLWHLDRLDGHNGAGTTDPDHRRWVPVDEVTRRFTMLERQHGPRVALDVAVAAQTATHHSPLHAFARTARTIGESIDGTVVLWPALTDLFTWQTRTTGDELELYASAVPDESRVHRLMEFFVSDMVLSGRRASAWQWSPLEITFAHAGDAHGWEGVLGAPVRFSASATTIRFAREHRAIRVSSADPDVNRLLIRLARPEHAPEEPGMVERTRRVVRTQLDAGHVPTLDGVARLLGRSRRSLHRDLATRGTRFSAILDEVRQAIDCTLGDLSDDERAERLGYSGGRALRRARTRWSTQKHSE